MPKLNQRGVITQILMLLILVAGLVAGLYLVKHPQIFKPKASNTGTRIEIVDASGNEISITSTQNVKVKVVYVAPSSTPIPPSCPPPPACKGQLIYGDPQDKSQCPSYYCSESSPSSSGSANVQGVSTTDVQTTSFPTQFRLANSEAELSTAQEIDFTQNSQIVDWTLSSGSGSKTIYGQFKEFKSGPRVWGKVLTATVFVSSPTPNPSGSSIKLSGNVDVDRHYENEAHGGLGGSFTAIKCLDNRYKTAVEMKITNPLLGTANWGCDNANFYFGASRGSLVTLPAEQQTLTMSAPKGFECSRVKLVTNQHVTFDKSTSDCTITFMPMNNNDDIRVYFTVVPKYPDLTITEIQAPNYVRNVPEFFNIHVIIDNIGKIDPSSKQPVTIEVTVKKPDGSLGTCSAVSDQLISRDRSIIQVNHCPGVRYTSYQNYPATGVVDPENQVTEVNKDNNAFINQKQKK